MIPEASDFAALAMQTSSMAVILLFAWALTLGPAICLLRGNDAADLMFKVTLYSFAVAVGTRLCNVYYFTLWRPDVPVGYLPQHGYTGLLARLDRPVLLMIWFCGGVAGHAFIYSASMLRHFWTSPRNRFAVAFYACALIVGLIHPLPTIHFWGNANRMALRAAQPQLEANRELTDDRTRQWVLEHPDDPMTLLMRANYLTDMRRYSEALSLYEVALQELPQALESGRAGIEKRMAETKRLLHRTQ